MRVIYSNFQEKLLLHLSEVIRSRRAKNHRHVVFLPSEALRVYYRDRLTHLLETTLDIDFCLSHEAMELGLELGWVDPSNWEKIISLAEYELGLVQLLSRYQNSLQPSPSSSSNSQSLAAIEPLLEQSPLFNELRRLRPSVYPLAKLLASCFDYYSVQALKGITEAPWDWQRLLLNELHREFQGRCSYVKAFEKLTQLAKERPIPGLHFYFVSFSRAPQAYLSWIQALDEYHSVDWLVLSPSRLFWSDLGSALSNQRLLSKAIQLESGSAPLQLESLLLDRNPLLANLVQVAKPLTRFLQEVAKETQDSYLLPFDASQEPGYEELWWQDLGLLDQPKSLLRALQTDLLLMRGHCDKRVHLPGDLSLIVHKCADPDCEVRALRGCLLKLLEKESDLQMADILVLAPDISRYRGLIERHFEATSRLFPFAINDVADRDEQGIIAALIHILLFSLSPWSFEEYSKLLQLHPLSDRWDTPQILRWLKSAVEEVNIQWGLDRDHRRRLAPLMGLDPLSPLEGMTWADFWSEQWRHLLKENSPTNSRVLSWGNKSWMSAMEFHQALLTSLEPWWSDQKNDIATWIGHVQQLLDRLLVSKNHPKELDRLNRWMESCSGLHFSNSPVTAQSFVDFAIGSLQALHTPWRSSTEGVLRFCSLQPMRSIPAKHIFLLGLSDDGRVKGPSRALFEWSLEEGISPRPTVCQLERYGFLETLLGARESLHLFYSRSDPQLSSEPPEPSYLLSELMTYLDHHFTIDEGSYSDRFHVEHASSWLHPNYANWPLSDLVALDRDSVEFEEPLRAAKIAIPEDLAEGFIAAPSNKELEALGGELALPFQQQLSADQIKTLSYDPLGYYISWNLKSQRGFLGGLSNKSFELEAPYALTKKWDELSYQESLDLFDAQIDREAPSLLSAQVWKQRCVEQQQACREHWKFQAAYRPARLSEGYEVLQLSTHELVAAPLIIKVDKGEWKLAGSLGWLDTQSPHVFVNGSITTARIDLLNQLLPYITAYCLGWLSRSHLVIYSKNSAVKPRTLDLESLQAEKWLQNMGKAAAALSQQPLLFHGQLSGYLLSGSPEDYLSELIDLVQSSEQARSRRLLLFLESLGCLSNRQAGRQKAQIWLELARRYLLPLWQPIFEVYGHPKRQEGED